MGAIPEIFSRGEITKEGVFLDYVGGPQQRPATREKWFAVIERDNELRAQFKAAYRGRITHIDSDYDGKSRNALGTWDETKHPRGQPENAGEFGPGGGHASAGSPVAVGQSKPRGTAGGGAGSAPPAGGLEHGLGLVSPNQGPPMDYQTAAQSVRSPTMRAWADGLEHIAVGCGLRARVSPAVGDWAPAGEQPGAEQSAEIELDGAQDYDQIKYAMSIMGMQNRQLAVLPFVEDHGGPDTVLEIETDASPENLRASLDKYDLPYRTVVDLGQGHSKVVIFDQGTKLEANAEALAHEYGSELGQRTGHGEFFPSGAESRENAVEQYQQFIAAYEQQHPERQLWGRQAKASEQNGAGAHNGIPVWSAGQTADAGEPIEQPLQTRMAMAYHRQVSRYAALWEESKHPRGQPENKGEFGPGGGSALPKTPSQSMGGISYPGVPGIITPLTLYPMNPVAPPPTAEQVARATHMLRAPVDAAGAAWTPQQHQAYQSALTEFSKTGNIDHVVGTIEHHHIPGVPLEQMTAQTGIRPTRMPDPTMPYGPDEMKAFEDQIREPRDPRDIDSLYQSIDAHPDMQETEMRLAPYMRAAGGNERKWSQLRYSDSQGHYQPDRQSLHDQIASHFLTPQSVAKTGTRPQALVLLGAPGSGKTTLSNRLMSRLGISCVGVSNDDIKGMMPEYQGWNSALLHDEANDVIEHDLIPKAVAGRHNLMWDGTGKDYNATKGIVDRLAAAGYDVHLGAVHCPAEKCAYRAAKRFLGNAFKHKNPGGEWGRFCDPRYIVEKVDGRPDQTYSQLKNHPAVKSWIQVNSDVPISQQPPVIDQGSR